MLIYCWSYLFFQEQRTFYSGIPVTVRLSGPRTSFITRAASPELGPAETPRGPPLPSPVMRLPREFSRKPTAHWPREFSRKQKAEGKGRWGQWFPVHTCINQESDSLAPNLGAGGGRLEKLPGSLWLASPGWLLPHKSATPHPDRKAQTPALSPQGSLECSCTF